MTNFNAALTCGDFSQGRLTAVIDVPMGSCLKIEWDRDACVFHLDRVEPMIFAKPVNYGFIPQTLDEDGDELDVLCVTREPLVTGLVVHARILGVLNFRDGGEMDYKIVIVPGDDRDAGDRWQTLDDLGGRWKQQMEHHFGHYKDFQSGSGTEVLGWGSREHAIAVVASCSDRWQQRRAAQ